MDDGAETTEDGKSFHARAPTTPNARSLTVQTAEPRPRYHQLACVADRRRRPESSSATQCTRSLTRYLGDVWLRQRKTSTASR